MSPGINAIERMGVEPRPHVGEVTRIEARKKARLEGNALAAKFAGPVNHPLHRVRSGRGFLLRVDVTEKPVVAVAVDADLHGQRPWNAVSQRIDAPHRCRLCESGCEHDRSGTDFRGFAHSTRRSVPASLRSSRSRGL